MSWRERKNDSCCVCQRAMIRVERVDVVGKLNRKTRKISGEVVVVVKERERRVVGYIVIRNYYRYMKKRKW